MDGIFLWLNVKCCAISKCNMNDGSYYYKVSFTNGSRVLEFTTGKKGDVLKLDETYNLSLDFDAVKRKLVICSIESNK